MSYIQGVDVSAYQTSIDWQKLRNQNIRFAFIKSTEGTHYINEFFDTQWAGAKSAGILRGSYHYLRAAVDGAQQADFFLSKVNVQDGDLPPVLDLEEGYNEDASNFQWVDNTQKWLERIESKTGRKPIVYSRAFFLKDHLNAPLWARDYPTWMAQYFDNNSDSGQPMQPAGWGDWIFWQYSQLLTLDGNYDWAGNVVPIDRDVYRYSLEELYKLAKAGSPIGGTVSVDQSAQTTSSTVQKTYTVKAGDTLNSIAIEHGTTQMAIATLNNLAKATDISVGMVLKLP